MHLRTVAAVILAHYPGGQPTAALFLLVGGSPVLELGCHRIQGLLAPPCRVLRAMARVLAGVEISLFTILELGQEVRPLIHAPLALRQFHDPALKLVDVGVYAIEITVFQGPADHAQHLGPSKGILQLTDLFFIVHRPHLDLLVQYSVQPLEELLEAGIIMALEVELLDQIQHGKCRLHLMLLYFPISAVESGVALEILDRLLCILLGILDTLHTVRTFHAHIGTQEGLTAIVAVPPFGPVVIDLCQDVPRFLRFSGDGVQHKTPRLQANDTVQFGDNEVFPILLQHQLRGQAQGQVKAILLHQR